MSTELKRSVVSGVAWSAAEKAGSTLFQLCVGIILAWFLVPEDYALVGILLVFTSVCSVFVDSGFSAALIRKKEVTSEEYSSVFFFNIAIAVILYILLCLLVPVLADFYGIGRLRTVGPVLLLLIPLNSLCIIQSAILTRKLDFKKLSKYTLWANFAASAVAIALAAAGAGVWALVGMRLATPLLRSLLLWINSTWNPKLTFSLSPLRGMWGYSSRLFLSDLANSVYANVSQLFIGKMYATDQLGYYEQARKWKDMPVNSVVTTIQGVTFPALSRLQDDHPKMSLTAHQVVEVMNFLMYPMMIGLIAVSPDFFAALLPERWLPTMPYFRILCISGLFVPLSVVSYNILKIRSDGRMIFRLEMVKKAVATLVLVLTIPVSVEAIVWGQVIIFFSDAVLNSFGARRFVRWRVADRVKEIIPYLLFSLVMWGCLWLAGRLLEGLAAPVWMLVLKIVLGAGVYFLLSFIFKPEGWHEVRTILEQMGRGRKR